MQVGIFGGSFNPPHLAHLIVAETVREQFALEQVLWMPSRQPPHKMVDQALVAPEHRLAMTRLAVEGNPAFTVSELEMQRDGPSYTIDTVERLQHQQPDTSFALIIGGDSLRELDTWHRPDAIVERVPLIVYDRPGARTSAVEPRFAPHVRFARAPLLEISGTDIRARYRQGHSIRYLVPERVRSYIELHRLYRD